jgi:hypothetical protein
VTQFGPVDEQEHEDEHGGWRRARPVLLTTLVPLVAAAGFFALATYGKRSADVTQEPSMAAFDACLTEHGLQSEGYNSQFDATVAAQQQMKVCGDKIPKAVIQKAEAKQRAAMASYRECLRNVGGSGGFGGFGRYRDGPSKSFRDAFSICRSLLGGGGSAPAPKPATPVGNVA